MWLAIRIGVLYAAPALAVAIALIFFVRLWRRVRRSELPRGRAVARFAWTLLLPVVAVLLVWATGELASYFAVGAGAYVFDASTALQFLRALAPLAAYVLLPILLMLGALAFAMPHRE